MTERSIANQGEFEDWEAHALDQEREEQGACTHAIAGPCPICRGERRADIAERELRETAEELERVRVRLEEATELLRECAGERADGTSILTADMLVEVDAFLSGAPARDAERPAPQHPDSALLDRIGSCTLAIPAKVLLHIGECYPSASELIAACRDAALRTRAARVRSGGGQ